MFRSKLKYSLNKQAGVFSEVAGMQTTNALPLGGLMNVAGGVSGYMDPVNTDREMKIQGARELSNFLPATAANRYAKRIKKSFDDSEKIKQKKLNSIVALDDLVSGSSTANTLLLGGAGALLGKQLNLGKHIPEGLGIGMQPGLSLNFRNLVAGGALGLSTAGVIHAIAGLTALLKKTRTKKDQADVDEEGGHRVLKRTLIPGLAAYDQYKRLGSTMDYDRNEFE